MSMVITKEHVGQTILALPTGNNARRRGADEPMPARVVSVGRRYAVVEIDGRRADKLDCNTGASESCIRAGIGGNAGYWFFADAETYDRWREEQKDRNAVKMFFRGHKQRSLSAEQVRQIVEMIEGLDE